VRSPLRFCLLATALAVTAPLALPAARASAEAPQIEILEPSEGGAPLNPADVHMVVAFADLDSDAHLCTDWEIWSVTPEELAWQAPCASGPERAHIHLGDGTFVGSHADRTELEFAAAYELRARARDANDEWSEWASRGFETRPPGAAGSDAPVPWTPRPGYAVEVFAGGFQLPVNIAMVPEPGPHPGDPLFYVAELYGTVKVVTRDGVVRDYATGLLNFNPTGDFPGSGEKGLAGLAVDPASGDLFASLVYEDESSPLAPKPHYAKVVRLQSDERGLLAIGQTTVLDLSGEPQGPSHQISHLAIGPGGELIVHNGDGFLSTAGARDLESFSGKILRMTLAGEAAADNPFYDAGDGVGARDYVWAYGFRNPWGGAFRLADGSYYEVENGPATDRLARVLPGVDYLWAGVDATMAFGASYTWNPAHAPVNIEFVEPGRFGGSGFPPQSMGHAFVTESGSTYASGPQETGKQIVEFDLGPEGANRAGPTMLAEYSGAGKATAVGLAAGEDGLYFTDLYKDREYLSPIDRGANVLRIRYCGNACPGRAAENVPAGPSVAARQRPRVSRFRLQRKRFAVRRQGRGAGLSVARYGTAFLYALSEPASVAIRIESAGGRLRGTLNAPGRPGPNRMRFGGRLARGALTPGHYLATIQARDADGDLSQRRILRFQVVRRHQ
jgi:glucose/arabinose dehydrogenase